MALSCKTHFIVVSATHAEHVLDNGERQLNYLCSGYFEGAFTQLGPRVSAEFVVESKLGALVSFNYPGPALNDGVVIFLEGTISITFGVAIIVAEMVDAVGPWLGNILPASLPFTPTLAFRGLITSELLVDTTGDIAALAFEVTLFGPVFARVRYGRTRIPRSFA